MFKMFLSKSHEALKALNCHVTVEAEYGSVVVTGSELTLAHHQPEGPFSSQAQPAPCNNVSMIFAQTTVKRLQQAMDRDGELRIGLSHIDLDSVGGVALLVSAIAGFERDMLWSLPTASFWRVAEYVDLHGPHRLDRAPDVSDEIKTQLRAYWAWARKRPEPKAVVAETVEVSDEIGEHMRVLGDIFRGQVPALLEDGVRMAAEEGALRLQTLVDDKAGVELRLSNGPFVNHLYGPDALAIVAFNDKLKTVTISLAEPIPGVDCRELVKSMWGPEAGGHKGIAESPRDRKMTFTEAVMARSALIEVLKLKPKAEA